jgi:hypothetical protein
MTLIKLIIELHDDICHSRTLTVALKLEALLEYIDGLDYCIEQTMKQTPKAFLTNLESYIIKDIPIPISALSRQKPTSDPEKEQTSP